MTSRFLFFLLAVLLVGSAAPARAQLIAEPNALSVTVAQGEETERTVTLSNTGSESVSFCLSFGRPLDRTASSLRLSDDALASACGEYGELLYRVSQAGTGTKLDIYGLTMTPDGRLFASDIYGDRTHELTQELEIVRSFFHPFVEEVAPGVATAGLTYDATTDKLWWLNNEEPCAGFGCVGVERSMLLEGDLDGNATGRRIELSIASEAPEPYDTGVPVGLSYEASTKLFYFVDYPNDTIWAVDTLGNVADGYPTQLEAYPDTPVGFGLDTHYGGQAGGSVDSTDLWLEAATSIPGLPGLRRIVAADRFGRSTAPKGAELLETPLAEPDPGNSQTGSMRGEPLRSTTDPNGLLYHPFGSFATDGVLGIRPHPLPPVWLALSEWDGTLGPDESMEITLMFSAGSRAVGSVYEAALQVFNAATDEASEVPLMMEVTESTAGEEEPEASVVSSLSVYPNPLSAVEATIVLALDFASDASVEVFDVLGRRVAVLHAGRLRAGRHRFPLGAARLPAGVYLVRVAAGAEHVTERIAIVR